VIAKHLVGKVRRMRLREHLSQRDRKRTVLTPNTVRKWLKASSDVVPKYERVKFKGNSRHSSRPFIKRSQLTAVSPARTAQ